MRVAIFTDSFLPHVSGVCSAVINQANELCRQGHEVMIFRPKAFGASNKRRLERSGDLHAKVRDVLISLPVIRQPGLRVALPTVAPTLPVVRNFKPDIIHVHTEWGCGWEGVMLAKMLRKPLVGTFHTFFAEPEYLRQFHLPNHKLTQGMMWRYSVFFYNHCDRILSPSRSVARQLVERGAEKNPHLLSNGIPAYSLVEETQIEEIRATLGIDGPCFVYVGRLAEEKSLPVLLRAFARVHRERPDSRLLVIGDGPVRPDLERQALDAGIAGAVKFTGGIPHARLMRDNLPRAGQIFVTPSKTENQPVSLLEAMVFGLPIIGAEAKGIPELIRNEWNGLLFPPDDDAAMARAMVRLLEDDTLRARCGQNARQFAAENSIESVVTQLVFHYRQTLETRLTRKRRRLRRRLRSLPRTARV